MSVKNTDKASKSAKPQTRTAKTLPDGTRYERPSERMFRRSRRAEDRRRKAARDDANFFKAVFSLAGVATGFVFILIYLAMSSMESSRSGNDGTGLMSIIGPLSDPWLGPFSKMEIFGGLFIAILAALYFWRIRKRD